MLRPYGATVAHKLRITRNPIEAPMSTPATAPNSLDAPKQRFLRAHLEFIIALLLGLVSIATAYASFQATVYNGQTAGFYAEGTYQRTKAESYFVEDNQTFVQDAQLVDRLAELRIDMQSPDATVAASASAKYTQLYGQSVSDELDAAITWADEQNAADPTSFTNPIENEKYVDDLFADYEDLRIGSHVAIDSATAAGRLSDRLTLNTVLLALSLFLLGIAALVKIFRVKVTLMSIAIVIFVGATIATAFIPFVGV